MGYTPLFDTLLSGTLYGRWPHTGVWACLLSRATREGVIDEIPQSLASAIGVPVDLLMSCIDDFMSPDKFSRTAVCDGRRLELIDPDRPWGWKIINHSKYREKARKSAFDAARVESGANAERMAARRAAETVDPTGPALTRADPLSSHLNSSPNAEANTNTFALIDSIKAVYPKGVERGDQWILAEREVSKLLGLGEPPEALIDASRLYAEQQTAEGTIGTGKILRPHNFFANGAWRGPFPMPVQKTMGKQITWRPTE